MSQFIRAIEIDQTPSRMLFQWGSQLAEEANQKAMRQQALEKLRLDQQEELGKAFGDAYKMGLDQTAELGSIQQDEALRLFRTNLAKDLKEAGGRIDEFKKLSIQRSLSDLSKFKANRGQVKSLAEAKMKDLEAVGINPDAVKGFAANYMLGKTMDPNFSAESFTKDLERDITERPHLYFNKDKAISAIQSRINQKGIEFDRSELKDVSGMRKLTVESKAEKKPWEEVGEFKAPNGLAVQVPKITFESIKDPGGFEYKVVTRNIVDNFIGGDPGVQAGVKIAAKEIVHDANKKMGFDTAGASREQFMKLKQIEPDLIDPFNDGVLDVYERLAVTRMIKPNYDDDGFSIAGKRGFGDDKQQKAGTVVNVNNISNAPKFEAFDEVANDIADAEIRGTVVNNKVGGKVTESFGVPLTSISSDDYKDIIISKANRGRKREDINDGNIVVKNNGDAIEVYKLTFDVDPTTGRRTKVSKSDFITRISKTELDRTANQSLGTKTQGRIAAEDNKSIRNQPR
jgi:hypothetical protein